MLSPKKNTVKIQKLKLLNSLQTRITFWFILLFSFALLSMGLFFVKGTPFTGFQGWQSIEKDRMIGNLNLLADLKKSLLVDWVSDRKREVSIISSDATLINNVSLLLSRIEKFTNQGLKNDSLVAEIKKNPINKNLLKILTGEAKHYTPRHAAYIADTETGKVISSFNGNNLGSDISSLYLFKRALTSEDAYIGRAFKSRNKQHNNSVVIPISHVIKDTNNKKIAVLVIEIFVDDIFLPYLHTGGGLGLTGEALLVNNERKNLTTLKHPLTDGSRPSPLGYVISAVPASMAAQGFEGVVESEDYRNHTVLAAYRAIQLSPDWRWGLVVKIDKDELFAPLNNLLYYFQWFIVICLALIIFSSLFLIRWITTPLRQLTRMAISLTSGDHSIRMPVKRNDEIGLLSNAFNTMAEALNESYTALEDKITNRTEKLREKEQQLELALSASNMGLWDWQVQTNEVYFDTIWCNLIGYQQNEIIPVLESFNQLVHPDDLDQLWDKIHRYLDGKSASYEEKYRMKHKNGEWIWILVRGKVVKRDEQGQAVRMIGTHTDITQRRRVEQHEQIENHILELIAKNVPMSTTLEAIVKGVEAEVPQSIASILLMDNDAKHLVTGAAPNLPDFYNEAINSFAIGDGVGSCGTAAFRNERIIVEDIQLHPYWEKYKELALRAGLAACWSEPIRDSQANVLGTFAIYFHSVKTTTKASLDIIGHAANLASIAIEQEKNQQALIHKVEEQKSILDNMADGVISIDESGNILSFNPAAEKLFAYQSKEIIGQNIKKLMPEPPANRHNDYLKRYIETNKAHIIGIGREVVGLKKNNTAFPIRIAVTELPKNAAGKRCFIGSVQDLTLQKQQEEQLRQSQKMDALGKLTGGIAHDYNNMLGVIMGYTELLQKKVLDNPDADRYLKNIRLATERSKNMTNKLLSFSRKKSSNAEMTDINEILKNDEEMLAKSLTARIELKQDLCHSPWPVWLDKSELIDMVLNLSINAQHAIPGQGMLTFKTHKTTLSTNEAAIYGLVAGDYMRLSITDTGIGMDSATQAKIFDPFFSTKGKQGTGLGLSQVFGFVERSTGAISVNSTLGTGTSFDIYFPRYHPIDLQAKTKETIDRSNYSGHEVLLVVDDEPVLREMVAEILSASGYQVLLAEGGQQALDILAKRDDISLMLSDVIMPKMNGFQLAEQVARQYPQIKIQMASGYSRELHNQVKDKNLLKNMLSKPYDNNDLLKKIRLLLDQNPNHEEDISDASKNKSESSSTELIQEIKWTAVFSTGIEALDEDHKGLVKLYNHCLTLLDSPEQNKKLGKVLVELQDYTRYHFQREEEIMQACDYPNLIKHQQVHKLLLKEVKKQVKEYDLGQLRVESLLSFFSDWLKEHILYMDKALASSCVGKQPQIEQALENIKTKQAVSNHL